MFCYILWALKIFYQKKINLRAVSASILVDVGVRLHVTIQHRLVYTAVVAVGTFKRFSSY